MNGTVEKRNVLWELKSSSASPEPEPSSGEDKTLEILTGTLARRTGQGEALYSRISGFELQNHGSVDIQPFIEIPSPFDDIILRKPHIFLL